MPADLSDKAEIKFHAGPLSRVIVALLFLLFVPFTLSGQHSSFRHKDKNEMAVIPSMVFDLSEKNFLYSLHGHYLRSPEQLSPNILVGASMEYIFGDETHITIGPVVAIHPAGILVFLYSPGFTIKSSSDKTEYYFSSHIEAALEFKVGGHLHAGPSAGFSLSGYDNHFSVGLHAGIAF